MIEEIKNIKSDKKEWRKFGITIGVILIIIASFLFWKEKDSFQIFAAYGVVLFLLGIIIPIILKPIYWLWMIFGTVLGWIMTRLILSLLFFFIISPIGLISRLFGKQFLELKWDKRNSSYWNKRTGNNINKNTYENQF